MFRMGPVSLRHRRRAQSHVKGAGRVGNLKRGTPGRKRGEGIPSPLSRITTYPMSCFRKARVSWRLRGSALMAAQECGKRNCRDRMKMSLGGNLVFLEEGFPGSL